MRSLMNEWYTEYPESSRTDLKGRFISNDQEPHLGALNELFLHALFRRLAYEVDVAPSGSRNKRRPDFFLRHATLQDFDLEATVVNVSKEERARCRRAADLYDIVDRIRSIDFMILVSARSGPDRNPPGRKVLQMLDGWLGTLDPDKISPAQRLDDLPTKLYCYGDWKIKFHALPKGPEYRSEAFVSTPIQGLSTGVDRLDVDERIRRSLKKKISGYGQRNRPYVIAICTGMDDFFIPQPALDTALFGTMGMRANLDTGDRWSFRIPDGIFWGPRGPKNTRVSGVILVAGLSAATVSSLKLVYMNNPWAEYPLQDFPNIFDRHEVKVVNEHKPPELGLHEFFALSEYWPCAEDDEDIDWSPLKQELESL